MIAEKIAKELGLKLSSIEATIALIDEGNTIPFIARYRKEVTGGMSDVDLRELEERLTYLRNLEERKQEIIRLIEEQGKLTDELRDDILAAEVLQRVEDLYKPYKQKRATRASKAKEKGLEPLAVIIRAMDLTKGTPEEAAMPFVCMDPELIEAGKGAATPEEALAGAADIIAEIIADDADFTQEVRQKTFEAGMLVSEAQDPAESTVYDMYYDYREGLSKIPNHRILAMNRGEKEKKLKVKLDAPTDAIYTLLKDEIITNEKSIFFQLMNDTVEDAYKRLMAPSVERELRNMLTERAEKEAVKVFAKNTENLLMVPPVKDARVISIDPGFRTGCKVTMLDETGKLLAYTTIYPTEPRKDIAGARKVILALAEKYNANVIVIGNGTASRETEIFISDLIKESGLSNLQYTIVNEAGASIYSASKLATEEYPDLDVTTRGAMSIGRRLQDPLAELVKISPKHIGVGQYQHDINQGLLDGALTNVVEDCVNRVGVDLNTASSSLLSYIAGINSVIAKNIVAFREEKGRFSSRKELFKVGRLGEKTYNQCAGFMRISGGSNPLDATAVHPESYSAAELMLEKLGIRKDEIAKGGAKQIEQKIEEVFGSLGKMAESLNIGKMTLTDIVGEIKKPARDPREGMPPVVFRSDVLSIEDLRPDMELVGTVRNVVDFGAFVDIGVKNDGLVHISQLSHKYVKNPMDVVSVGDTVKVKVLSVDTERQKVSLTMKL
ncbi:Tex family protein [Bacillota bacterium]